MLDRALNLSPPARNRVFLLFLMTCFAAPLLAAWILVGVWHPAGSVSHGELLDPVQPVSHFRVGLSDGGGLTETFLRERWTLVYARNAALCDETCRRSLYHIRQVRLALGRNAGRVQKLFMLGALPERELRTWLAREHADMPAGVPDRATRAFFPAAFSGTLSDDGWIYLIDPLGNLVMRYRSDSDPSGILKDLKRLLKLSRIG